MNFFHLHDPINTLYKFGPNFYGHPAYNTKNLISRKYSLKLRLKLLLCVNHVSKNASNLFKYSIPVRSNYKQITSLIKELRFQTLLHFLGEDEFLPHSSVTHLMSKLVCSTRIQKRICTNLLFLFCGFDEEQFNVVSFPRVW